MISPEQHQSHWEPEHMLIANVISLAVKDACLEPIRNPLVMQWDSKTAHDFLWGEGLESYIHWLNIDVNFLRRKIIETMENDKEGVINGFRSEERRAFRWNKKTWDRESARLGGRMASSSSDEWDPLDSTSGERRETSVGNSYKYISGRKIAVEPNTYYQGE
jgi:hypothetical protein